MDYAIIRLGGKQYRVREGETLVVDRVKAEAGKTFSPEVLLGDGASVTAKVVAHERGPKIRVGKYRRRTGYKRHTGFRAATSRIEISLGAAKKATAKKTEPTKQDAPKREAQASKPKAAAPAAGLPDGYEGLTVAQVSAAAKTWDRAAIEAALDHEQTHAARKGAIAALESALKAKEA
jgi:large subunit ribosomal protein L21